jgi:integrase
LLISKPSGNNSIATRNARLGAIHVFARYLAGQRPEHLGTLQRIIGMPFKRGAVEAPIEYLDRAELDALLKSIDPSTRLGRRDYALFAFMFNTGARVQEALNVRVADVRLRLRRRYGCSARLAKHASVRCGRRPHASCAMWSPNTVACATSPPLRSSSRTPAADP